MNLSLRQDFQNKYKDAIKNNQSTITAAPFFSLKTSTIKQALAGSKNVAIIDLRQPLNDNQIGNEIKHIFLDSIEVASFEDLTKLIASLQKKGKTIHLITHLYHYELAKKALPKAQKIFPQLLLQADIELIKDHFSKLPEAKGGLIDQFIDYFEGLPAIVHTFDSPKKVEIIRQFAFALAQTPKAKPAEYFQRLADQFLKLPANILKKVKAVDQDLAQKPMAVTTAGLEQYLSNKIDLKDLIEQIEPKLWHYVRYGWLWLDQEKAELRVPAPLANLK